MNDSGNTSSSHVSPDQLLAFHQNQVTAAEREAIEEHFVRCRACTDQSIDLARFLRPDEADAEPVGAPLLPWPPRDRRRSSRPAVLRSLAAVLLVALGLSVFLLLRSGQFQRARHLEMEPNVPIVTLDATALRRDAGQPPPASVPVGSVLILLPEQPPANAGHRLEILTAAGARVDYTAGLRPTEQGQFHLRLPRTLTPGAAYRIRILYPGQDHAEEFPLRIATPAAH